MEIVGEDVRSVKKVVHTISKVFAMVFFTLMFVIDNFPNLGLNMSIGAIGVIIFIILAVITRQKDEPVYKSSKQELIFTLLSGIYLFSLLLILRLLGGVSQSGIDLGNPILWVLFLIGLVISFRKYKKELKQEGMNNRTN